MIDKEVTENVFTKSDTGGNELHPLLPTMLKRHDQMIIKLLIEIEMKKCIFVI